MNSLPLNRQLINLNTKQSNVDSFHTSYRSFAGNDTASKFQTNLTTQPLDWIYRNKSIQYSLNNQLYRCEPFNKIDWSNSIVIFGCSNVFGVGVDDNDTISSRLKELTGINVVNLGCPASGQQVSLYNMILLKNNNIKPKAIIHCWTDSMRPFFVDKDYKVQHNGPWNNFGFPEDTPESILNEVLNESKSHTVSAMFNRITANLLYNDIPVVHATHFKQMWDEQHLKYPNLSMIFLPYRDKARDLGHPGIESNKLAAQLLHEELIKLGASGETRTLNP